MPTFSFSEIVSGLAAIGVLGTAAVWGAGKLKTYWIAEAAKGKAAVDATAAMKARPAATKLFDDVAGQITNLVSTLIMKSASDIGSGPLSIATLSKIGQDAVTQVRASLTPDEQKQLIAETAAAGMEEVDELLHHTGQDAALEKGHKVAVILASGRTLVAPAGSPMPADAKPIAA